MESLSERAFTDSMIPATFLIAALGAGLVAGVLFAFSSFIMPALHRLPADQGIAAMQSINKLAPRPAFMIAFIGTALLCAALGVRAILNRNEGSSTYILIGTALYLVGTLGLTAARNIPLNDTLAAIKPHAAGAGHYWDHYVSTWTALNHIRTATALGASAMFVLALRVA
jgi:uncharacterized membrane protein